MTRREIGKTGFLAVGSAVAIFVGYAVIPFVPNPREAIWSRLLVGVAAFSGVLYWQARAIARHHRPLRRAIMALGILVPLFVVIYAANYVTMSRSAPESFNNTLSKTEGIYFTVTVLSTVGFGDIVPETDPARILVTTQMILNFVLIGGVVRLIVGLGSREAKRRQRPPAPVNATTGDTLGGSDNPDRRSGP